MIILSKQGDMIDIPGIVTEDVSVLKLLAKSAPNLEVLAIIGGAKKPIALRDIAFFRTDSTGVHSVVPKKGGE